jgi:hypothetical protein
MSPYQRVLSLEASAVKSCRILSARAAAAGSGIVVVFRRFAALQPGPTHRPGDPLAGVPQALSLQRSVDLRRAVTALAVHRVSFAKKAVVRLRMSTSSRSLRFSRRSSASSLRSSLVRPPSPAAASRSACLTHSRTAVSVRSRSLAT